MSVNHRTSYIRFLFSLSFAFIAFALVPPTSIVRAQDGSNVRLADGRGLQLLPSTVHAIYQNSGRATLASSAAVVLASANGDGEPAKLPSSGKTLPLNESSRKIKRVPRKEVPQKSESEQDDSPIELEEGSSSPKDKEAEEETEEAGESEAFRKILESQFQRKDLQSKSNSLREKAPQPDDSLQPDDTLRFTDESAEESESTDTDAAIPTPEEVLQLLNSDQGESVDAGESTEKAVKLEPSQSDADSKNCPGSPVGEYFESPPQPDDIDVEQEDHPYDAPAAASEDDDLEPGSSEDDYQSLSGSQVKMRDEINRVLQYYLNKPENVARRGPWALMHASLPFGVEAEIVAGRRKVNALGWMCYNGVCARQRMFQATRSGFRPNVGPGVQGHEGQFLAILAQSQVAADYQIRVGNRRFTIKDLVRHEQRTCRERSELTFKLIGLSYYLPQDATWRDNRGRAWNLEKMVAEELAQPINGAACGGTHRLMGLSFAVIERQKAGLPIKGYWAKAEKYLNDYVNYAMTLQNSDGSFSTEWFESRGQDQDVERKVQTTGHILEWLIYTLPDEHLHSPRIEQSVNFLLRTVGTDLSRDWPIGPRGHALRALSLYSQRVLGAEPGQMKQFIADSGKESYR